MVTVSITNPCQMLKFLCPFQLLDILGPFWTHCQCGIPFAPRWNHCISPIFFFFIIFSRILCVSTYSQIGIQNVNFCLIDDVRVWNFRFHRGKRIAFPRKTVRLKRSFYHLAKFRSCFFRLTLASTVQMCWSSWICQVSSLYNRLACSLMRSFLIEVL